MWHCLCTSSESALSSLKGGKGKGWGGTGLGGVVAWEVGTQETMNMQGPHAFAGVPMQAPNMGFRGPPGPGQFAFEKPFPVVRLRGLPFNANELDIFEFFQARSLYKDSLFKSAHCLIASLFIYCTSYRDCLRRDAD